MSPDPLFRLWCYCCQLFLPVQHSPKLKCGQGQTFEPTCCLLYHLLFSAQMPGAESDQNHSDLMHSWKCGKSEDLTTCNCVCLRMLERALEAAIRTSHLLDRNRGCSFDKRTWICSGWLFWTSPSCSAASVAVDDEVDEANSVNKRSSRDIFANVCKSTNEMKGSAAGSAGCVEITDLTVVQVVLTKDCLFFSLQSWGLNKSKINFKNFNARIFSRNSLNSWERSCWRDKNTQQSL